MPKAKPLTMQEKKLARRYLIWCYKTTKEELDKVDRYFTQQRVDELVLRELRKAEKKGVPDYRVKVDGFEAYMKEKLGRAMSKKFVNSQQQALQPDYLYLSDRLTALKKVIRSFLGDKGLKAVEKMYEEEMTRRILAARDH